MLAASLSAIAWSSFRSAHSLASISGEKTGGEDSRQIIGGE